MVGVVAVDGADADAGPASDIVDLSVGARFGEHLARAVQDPLAVAAGVGAQRAFFGAENLAHVTNRVARSSYERALVTV